MTADIELLPLPEYLYGREASDNERVVTVADAHAYAVRNVAHHTAAKDAEIEALRTDRDSFKQQAEHNLSLVERLRGEVDQWCRQARYETEVAAEAIARAERLAEALRLIASPQRPDGTWNRDREACRQIARAALDQEGGNE